MDVNTVIWRRQTNLRAEQVKQSKPTLYYAKNFKPVCVPELKAILGLRLQIERCVNKLRYESYWKGADHNLISYTPGFREVMEHNRFITLWGFLHLVDQTDEAVDKSNKIYKKIYRNLHRPGKGPPLAPPRISRQCFPSSRGELAVTTCCSWIVYS